MLHGATRTTVDLFSAIKYTNGMEAKHIAMEYNEYIKELRTRKGLTQQQLADAVGVSRQTVTRWENGWTVPTLYYAQKLAILFGLTVSELMTGQAEMETQPQPSYQTKPQTSIAATTARFAVLTFLPVAVYCIIWYLLSAINYGLISGGSVSPDIIMRGAYDATFDLCLTVIIAMTAFWIIRLVAGLRRLTDKFQRYEFYKTWNIGFIFALTNVLTLVFVSLSFIMSFLPVIYIGTAFVGVAADFAFGVVFKKAYGARMVTGKNRKLEIINTVFAAIAATGIVAFTAYVIYIVAAFYPACGLEIGFAVIFALAVTFVIEAAYIITRIVVRKRLA